MCRYKMSDSRVDRSRIIAIILLAGCPPHPATAAARRLFCTYDLALYGISAQTFRNAACGGGATRVEVLNENCNGILFDMARDDQILTALNNLSGDQFEAFAVTLVGRELYPGINPTSASHDGGEDAITYPSVTFLNKDKYISVAASITGTLVKIRKDCLACKANGRSRDILVFVTIKDIRSDKIEEWKGKIKTEFGWELEVRTSRWMLPVLGKPENETLVDDQLNVPPPSGDFSSVIKDGFSKIADLDLGHVRLKIPGLIDSIQRSEINLIEDQLVLGKSVIVSGDPGTGKSALGAMLAQNARNQGKVLLFVDARRFASFNSESDLSKSFHLKGTFVHAIERIGKHEGCRVIIDQFDTVIGLEISDVLAEIASAIASFQGVEVVIISRKREGHEEDGLNYLNGKGFVEIESHPISQDQVLTTLKALALPITDELLRMGSNLLNLEIIGQIKEENPSFNFTNLLNEVDLWNKYIETVRVSETRVINTSSADSIVSGAIQLARMGLREPDRDFSLNTLSKEQQRLVSWGIIFKVEGYQYRFRHEKLQDFLYAKDAVDRGWLKDDVLKEIPKHRTLNIFPWMQSLYQREQSSKRLQLMKDILNV